MLMEWNGIDQNGKDWVLLISNGPQKWPQFFDEIICDCEEMRKNLFKSFSEGFKGYSIWIECIGKVKN